jgi:hypothetical protein
MEIKFTTADPSILEHFPPRPANKVIPSWYKDLETWRTNEYEKLNVPTIKMCIPVQDMITTGYILPNVFEFVLDPVKKGRYEDFKLECQDQEYIKKHHHEQCPVKHDGINKHFFKITNHWGIKTPPGYSCLFIQPFYQFEPNYVMLPAIVDTDVHDVPVEFPGYIVGSKAIHLQPGDPIMQVIPFKRDDWQMTVASERPLKSKLFYKLNRAYQSVFHNKKSFK